jgi:hypothetical protein
MFKKMASALPSLVTSFIGRKEAFKTIDSAKNNQHIIIHAFPGIGKTSCALKYAKIQAETQNVIARWFDADSREKLIESYTNLAKELNINIISPFKNSTQEDIKQQEVLVNLVNEQLKKQGDIIFIFDNTEKFKDVELYITKLPTNVKTIITTSDSNFMDASWKYKKIELEPFNEAEAQEYLQISLNGRATKKDIGDLIKRVGTTPYKLSKAVSYLNINKSSSISDYLEKLQKNSQSSSQAETDILLEILSNHKEGEEAWQILQYISYLDPDFIYIEIIEKLLSIDKQTLQPVLDLLFSFSFISIEYKNENKGIKIHKLLQEEIKNYIKIVNPEEIPILSRQEILDNIVKTLNALFPTVKEAPDKEWDMAKLLYTQVSKISDNEFDNADIIPYMADLSSKVGHYFHYVISDYNTALKYYKRAFDMRSEINKTVKSEITESFLADAFIDLGKLYSLLNKDKESLKCNLGAFKIIENLSKENPSEKNNADLASVYILLGSNYENLYQVTNEKNNLLDLALRCLTKGLSICRTLGNSKTIADSLNAIAGIYDTFNDHEKALENYKEALDIRKKLYTSVNNNHPDIAESLNNIGLHYHGIAIKCRENKQYDIGIQNEKSAIHYLHQSLLMLKTVYDTDNHYMIAGVYYNLGLANKGVSNIEGAKKNFEKALYICKELYPSGSYQTIKSLNSLALISKNYSKNILQAYKFYQEGLEICKILELKEDNIILTRLIENLQKLVNEDNNGTIRSYLSAREEEEKKTEKKKNLDEKEVLNNLNTNQDPSITEPDATHQKMKDLKIIDAMRSNDYAALQSLIEQEANPFSPDVFYNTALSIAISEQNTGWAKFFLYQKEKEISEKKLNENLYDENEEDNNFYHELANALKTKDSDLAKILRFNEDSQKVCFLESMRICEILGQDISDLLESELI